MAVTIKSSQEIELMRQAGKILAKVHEGLKKELKPGMSTFDIDRIGEEMIRSFGCEPSFKNYQGYPASVCVSINEEVVHGIPRKDRIIEEGDIVSLDTGVIYKGYQSDAARTHGVGEITEDARLLIERTRQSFFEGMKYAVAGNHLHDISGAIGDYAESFGYGVVRDLCGHGIGTHMHEDPEIPNYRKFRSGSDDGFLRDRKDLYICGEDGCGGLSDDGGADSRLYCDRRADGQSRSLWNSGTLCDACKGNLRRLQQCGGTSGWKTLSGAF